MLETDASSTPQDGSPPADPAALWIKSAEMQRIMRETLKPWIVGHGFKVTREGLYGWARPLADRYLILWIQSNRYNDPLSGGSFTLEFQLSKERAAGVGDIGFARQRVGFLMDPIDLPHYVELRMRVLREIPLPTRGQRWFAGGSWWTPKAVDATLSSMEMDLTRTIKFPDDVWFPFYTAEHVQAWAMFLALRMHPLVRAFLELKIAGQVIPRDPTWLPSLEEGRRVFATPPHGSHAS